MKKSYWLYKMCLLLGLGICIPVTGNASDIGDATLTQQQSKITASGVSSIIKSTPVNVSSVLMFLPSLPIILPFISSFGNATT